MPIVLHRDNIQQELAAYLLQVASTKVPTFSADPLVFFEELKRGHIEGGRYPGHSPLEVANRVMSDLVVFAAAERLLREPLPGHATAFGAITAQLGTENSEPHDLGGRLDDGTPLCGECFNVSPSFFGSKLNKTRSKLKKAPASAFKLIAFNADAPKPDWKPKLKWLSHWRLDVDALVVKFGAAVRLPR